MTDEEFAKQVNDSEEQAEGQFWTPSSGEFLSGKCLSVREVNARFGPSLVIKVDDLIRGPISHYCPSMLKDLIFEAGSTGLIGKRVGIKFMGIPTGKKWKKYVLTVDDSETN